MKRFLLIMLFLPVVARSQQMDPSAQPKDSSKFVYSNFRKEADSLGEVIVVSSTRSNRNIELIPTRLEAISREELEEKSSMKPGDIRMLLNETTGITTQQTSAVSGSSDIRIQGLDGKYTQLLKDGMPLYNGFSGGLSIMQIPPLDLKQVEMIKGSASTLYGGGAIAGLVNLISKTPKEAGEASILLNGTSANGFDLSSFYGKRTGKLGTTLFGAYNHSNAYDPAGIGFSAIPQTDRFMLNPKVFFYPNARFSGYAGINLTTEKRIGGDMNVLNGMTDNVHRFFETNHSFRISTQVSLLYKIDQHRQLQLKQSIGWFDRNMMQSNSGYHGRQVSDFTELNYTGNGHAGELVAGLDASGTHLHSLDTSAMKYDLSIVGCFVQHSIKPLPWISIESGIRLDHSSCVSADKPSGIFALPRINLLFKINEHWSSRWGGSLGYKMPSPFDEEAESLGYQHIQPMLISDLKAEESRGAHADVHYRTKMDEFLFSFNQLFFITHIDNPLLLNGSRFENANGFLETKGMETNIRLGFDELNFYIGYTLADVKDYFNHAVYIQPLSAKHRINFDATYEVENHFRVGLESFYTSSQQLHDGTTGKSFVVFGFLFEKVVKNATWFINAENFTDQRQTRWDKIYTGTITSPSFRDIYAPLDGRIINAGLKLNL